MPRQFQVSPLALAILAFLSEEPMHPYRIQRLIKERGKNQVINVRRRESLYQTIRQLQRAGLIAVRETMRAEKRPERTVYELTDQGRQTARLWLRSALATLADEFPAFPAALSLLALLTPDDARRQLETRATALAERLAQLDAETRQQSPTIPRLFLLENEQIHTTLEAELRWVQSVVEDLRLGRLTWSKEWIHGLDLPGHEQRSKQEE